MPDVDPIPGAETCYEGQDGYALVDRARYQAMEAECVRLRADLAAMWADPARECRICGAVPGGTADVWCPECVAAIQAESDRRLDGPADAAELAALRRDAQRYRWLRRYARPVVGAIGRDRMPVWGFGLPVLAGESLDAAIDAARGGEDAT